MVPDEGYEFEFRENQEEARRRPPGRIAGTTYEELHRTAWGNGLDPGTMTGACGRRPRSREVCAYQSSWTPNLASRASIMVFGRSHELLVFPKAPNEVFESITWLSLNRL